MLRYVLVSLAGGMIFGAMDGVINANPLAQRLFMVYQPIARTSVNAPAGIVIDLVYGLVMAGIFLLLYPSLPGASGWIKGVSFAVLAWFFRVLMNAASDWMMFKVPAATLLYGLGTGLLEMLVIGILFGLTLRPAK
jgi:hypothetical protein